MIIRPQDLDKLGFSEPYPHGERYLFDESCKLANGWCIIMCVSGQTANYNSQRGMWCDDREKYFDSGFIDLRDLDHLKELIEKSKQL